MIKQGDYVRMAALTDAQYEVAKRAFLAAGAPPNEVDYSPICARQHDHAGWCTLLNGFTHWSTLGYFPGDDITEQFTGLKLRPGDYYRAGETAEQHRRNTQAFLDAGCPHGEAFRYRADCCDVIGWSDSFNKFFHGKIDCGFKNGRDVTEQLRGESTMQKLNRGDYVRRNAVTDEQYTTAKHAFLAAGAAAGESFYGLDDSRQYEAFGWSDSGRFSHWDSPPCHFSGRDVTERFANDLKPVTKGCFIRLDGVTEAEFHAFARDCLAAGADKFEYNHEMGKSDGCGYLFGWRPDNDLEFMNSPNAYDDDLTGAIDVTARYASAFQPRDKVEQGELIVKHDGKWLVRRDLDGLVEECDESVLRKIKTPREQALERFRELRLNGASTEELFNSLYRE